MPSWKKVVVSGSDATLNSVSGSSFVYSGADVTAQQNLRSINSSGDEGGEIFLSKAATNTTLIGGVTIDVWQNRLRLFEQGGSARGYFLDISAGGAGVSTNLASGGGTVTSVGGQGSVSGITLTGTVTASGSLTLGGSISGLTNSNLSGTAGITNANLANSSITIGSTATSLGGTSTTLAGLSSVTSTTFVGALTGNASTATQTTATVTGTNSADLVYANMADNDQFRIRVGGTATNAGFVEIATADDGTEPIYVRQYTGVFTSLARTATLLDGSGNTSFPGTVTANGTLLTGNTGTVTSVATAGSVNGITLTGGFSTSGTLTLGGTLSGIGNAQLTNSAITIAGTSTSLGGSISAATILSGTGVFSGSAQVSGIGNSQLTNSSITVGSTAISLGSSATTIAGLSSVTSTTFVGALTGNASTATNLSTNNTNWSTNGTITAVVGQLAWKNYNNNHTIFDASAGTAPDGSSINATNSQFAWQSSYPTLMGWNTANTYGVRVDSARVADSAGSTTAALTAGSYLTSGGTFNGSTARTFAVDATDSNTVSKVVARDASGNFAAGRITTTGLYGPGGTGNIPIWQYDLGTEDYGIVYNEDSPDTMRFDVSGNALTGTPDFLVGDDYAQINGSTVWHAGNDGASSGLDADLLDGQHGSFYYAASNPSGYTTNTGTVTSVATAGSVNGITLTGGPITGTGTITLGGTLSGIGNAQLTNSSITVGSTAISLGSSATTIAGLSSVTSTTFVGALTGNASTATTAATASSVTITDKSSDDQNYYLTFTPNSAGGSPLSVDTALVYTPSLDLIQSTVSQASKVQTVQSATNADFFVTFVDTNNVGFGTYEIVYTDTGIKYNPSTNILTTTASFATNAASASAVLAGDFAAGTYSVPWMSNKTAGVATYFEGDTILQYETATGRLSTTTFNGALTGNATTATTAASSSTILANNFAAGTYSIPWMSQTSAGVATRLNGGTSLTYITSTGQLNNTGSVHIQQTSNVIGSGLRLRQQGTANYWDMFVTASTGTLTNGLQFRYNGGANGGYLDALTNVAVIDFTGQHRSLSNTINITGSADLTGLIVVADGTYTNLNNNHLPQINEALPNVSLSTTINDKRVFGVISDKEDRGSRQYAMGSWVSTFNVSKTEDPRLIINSLGEGGMWICNANGTLENGDYITTSNLPGYGMKQADDVLHNYTVAKITEDCLFDSIRTIDFEYSGSAYKKQFVGVTYHCG
jgi:hypothetical protein